MKESVTVSCVQCHNPFSTYRWHNPVHPNGPFMPSCRRWVVYLLLLSAVGVGRRVDAKRTKRKGATSSAPPTWVAELTVTGWQEASTAHQAGDLATAATRYQSLLHFPGV